MHRTGSKSAPIRVAREADDIIVEIHHQACGMPPEKLAQIQSCEVIY
jgi:hypothetical protein